MRQREVWIDVVKGIGIVAVVLGHVLSTQVGILWHIPLFFILAGYNCHPTDIWPYIKKLTRRLLIPYFVWLFGILLLQCVLNKSMGESVFVEALKDAMYGGVRLSGVFGVFWFITVLYFMLIGLQLLLMKGLRWWMVGVLIAIGYLPMFFHVVWPWNIQVVPMALAYGCTGALLKKTIDGFGNQVKWYWLAMGLLVLAALSLIPALNVNMKYNDFGMPVVSFLASVFCSLVIFVLAKRCENVRWFSVPLSWFGRGSLVVMYVHVLVFCELVKMTDNLWICALAVLAISMVIYQVVEVLKRWTGSMKIKDS